MHDAVTPATISLNTTEPQTVYEHLGLSDFTPTGYRIRRRSGPMPSEGASTKITLTDDGPGLLRVEILLSALDESGESHYDDIEVAGVLSNGQKVIATVDQAYGDAAAVEITLVGM